MQNIPNYLPVPSQRRSGEKLDGVKYIVCHDTGNDGSTAAGNVSYYKASANEIQASAHAFVDDTGAIWCIPENEKAWHVRYSAGIAPNLAPTFANDVALGIELCFGSTWAKSKNLAAYANYVTLIASLCKKYSLDPTKALIAHGALDPSRRTDPYNAFSHINKLWLAFIADVKTAMITVDPMVSIQVPQSKLSRVLAFINSIFS